MSVTRLIRQQQTNIQGGTSASFLQGVSNTEIVFGSGSATVKASGSSNLTYNYVNNSLHLTGSYNQTGSVFIKGNTTLGNSLNHITTITGSFFQTGSGATSYFIDKVIIGGTSSFHPLTVKIKDNPNNLEFAIDTTGSFLQSYAREIGEYRGFRIISGVSSNGINYYFESGSLGINKHPIYTLDVAGSGAFSNNLTVTGSLIASGSIVDFTKTLAISGSEFSGSFSGKGNNLIVDCGTY